MNLTTITISFTSLLAIGLVSLGPASAPVTSSPSQELSDSAKGPFADPFPTPSRGMVIGVQDSMSLLELLDEFSRVTGEHILYSQQAVIDLADSTTGLQTEMSVAPEDVYERVQAFLIQDDYILLDVSRGPFRMLEVQSLQWRLPVLRPDRARYVPEEELELYARAHAIVITTVIDAPNVSPAEIARLSHPRWNALPSGGVTPIPGTGQVVLTGPGTRVVKLSRELRAKSIAALGATTDEAKSVK